MRSLPPRGLLSLFWALLLALPGLAGAAQRGPLPTGLAVGSARLYAPVSPEWLGLFSGPSASAGLSPRLALAARRGPQVLAPVFEELSQTLGYTPASFASLTPGDRTAALELAAEEASEAVTRTAIELMTQTVQASGGALRSWETMLLAARLRELDSVYSPLLNSREMIRAVKDSAATALSLAERAVEASLAGAAGEADAAWSAPNDDLSGAEAVEAGNRAMLENFRISKSGRRRHELRTLLTSFGFTYDEGKKHDVYWHPDRPDLRSTVSRTNKNALPVGYVQTAVSLIDQLMGAGEEEPAEDLPELSPAEDLIAALLKVPEPEPAPAEEAAPAPAAAPVSPLLPPVIVESPGELASLEPAVSAASVEQEGTRDGEGAGESSSEPAAPVERVAAVEVPRPEPKKRSGWRWLEERIGRVLNRTRKDEDPD